MGGDHMNTNTRKNRTQATAPYKNGHNAITNQSIKCQRQNDTYSVLGQKKKNTCVSANPTAIFVPTL